MVYEGVQSMARTMTMERAGMGMMGLGTAAIPPQPMAGQPGMPAAPAMMMVTRCTITIEKCAGGMKFTCAGDDKVAASTMQSLCAMLAGGMCSCCMTMNGMVACCYNMVIGQCKCEMTDDGVCLNCTSGDKECAAMIQACGECMAAMMKAGCTCCVMMNNVPICCG
jgi:hypothetical protein